MKKILFMCAIAAALTSCKQDQRGDITTPKGVIIEAVRALTENRSADFNAFLSAAALNKYGKPSVQQALLKSLGDVRQIKLSDEKVLSHNTHGNSTVTVSQIGVLKDGSEIYTVTTQCTQTTTTSTHTSCHDHYYPPSHEHDYYPPHHDYNPPSHDNGGFHDDGPGYITPGVTHEVEPGSSSDDGHKPGNNDPDRPPRFLTTMSWTNSSGQECDDYTDTNTSVVCKIIDIQ